jgi:hypothetical protein
LAPSANEYYFPWKTMAKINIHTECRIFDQTDFVSFRVRLCKQFHEHIRLNAQTPLNLQRNLSSVRCRLFIHNSQKK